MNGTVRGKVTKVAPGRDGKGGYVTVFDGVETQNVAVSQKTLGVAKIGEDISINAEISAGKYQLIVREVV